MVTGEGSKPNFLDFAGFLMLSVFPVFSVLLVFEFSIVKNFCNWGSLRRGNLHKIQTAFPRQFQGIFGWNRSNRNVLIVNQMDLPNVDPLVYSEISAVLSYRFLLTAALNLWGTPISP